MTAADLATYVGASEDNPFIQACLDQATALVAGYVGTAVIPEAIQDRAVVEVGSELYHRQKAPNGVAQFSSFDGAPVRVARDPMVGAYPILRPFIGGGFA